MKICLHIKTSLRIFIRELFIIAKKWEQPKSPLTCEWTREQTKTLVHPWNEILLSIKINTYRDCNRDEPQKHHSKREKPDTQKFHFHEMFRTGKSTETEIRLVSVWDWRWNGDKLVGQKRDLTGVMKILLNWITVIIGKFTRNYCVLKCVKFMVCKLWLNYVFKKGTV